MILLVGAGLMIRSFDRLMRVDPGFKADNLLTMELSLPQARYGEGEPQTANFFREILGRIETLPGVESVGATWILPLSGQGAGSGFEIEGRDPATISERTNSAFSAVSPDYFHTMSIPIVKGREFGDDIEEYFAWATSENFKDIEYDFCRTDTGRDRIHQHDT